jgi:hypothetical protein
MARNVSDKNYLAPYFYRRVSAMQHIRRMICAAISMPATDNHSQRKVVARNFEMAIANCPIPLPTPAGLPLSNDQKKTRLRSHLSA